MKMFSENMERNPVDGRCNGAAGLPILIWRCTWVHVCVFRFLVFVYYGFTFINLFPYFCLETIGNVILRF
jgi:hypothetical protein